MISVARSRQALALLVSAGVALGMWGAARTQAQDVVDLVLLQTLDAVAAVDTTTGEVTARVRRAVPSPDGSVLVRADRRVGGTRLVATSAGSGEERWRRDIDGRWEVRLVGPDGQTVVLGSPGGEGIYTPVPRNRTSLLVSTPQGTERYDVNGNLEPEALALDGESVFVISYLPPLAPDRYQVRRLDLASGEVVDVFTPDAHLQEAMGGTARVQVWAAGGDRLYTLYTQDGPGGRHAFVHVLDLAELWAHCILLPGQTATTDEASVALALGEQRLYVADTAVGTLTEINTDSLTVERTGEAPALPLLDASAAVGTDGRIFVAAGQRVEAIDADSLRRGESWRLSGEVVGVAPARSGAELFVVLRQSELVVLDASSGEQLRRFSVGGTQPVEAVGTSAKRVPPARDSFDCAC